ncbi:MAG: synaptobrevin-B [Lachnospiraceae bacterium]|nr:synaptobrevin-B [Lachnospiraceae bacterium]
MMNFNNKKTKRIFTGVIIAILVVAMVLPMILSFLVA